MAQQTVDCQFMRGSWSQTQSKAIVEEDIDCQIVGSKPGKSKVVPVWTEQYEEMLCLFFALEIFRKTVIESHLPFSFREANDYLNDNYHRISTRLLFKLFLNQIGATTIFTFEKSCI